MGVAEAVASASGPLSEEEAAGLPAPPVIQLPQPVQLLRFNQGAPRHPLAAATGARGGGGAAVDGEIRDELLTLVLAGHETTANSLAWAWERLVRTPDAHERLVAAVRSGDGAAAGLERRRPRARARPAPQRDDDPAARRAGGHQLPS